MTKKNKKSSALPETCQLEVWGTSGYGDLMARTVDPQDNPADHKIYVIENKKIKPALQVGDRFIARLSRKNDAVWAKPLARTAVAGAEEEKLYGIIEEREHKFYLKSADKKSRMDYLLDSLGKAKVGDFVSVVLCGDRKFKQARILKSFGPFNVHKSTEFLILEKYGIPIDFPAAVAKECARCPQYHFDGRWDITTLPLVTIDGDDSKDFDDAVYARRLPDGFELIVAIADVAFYVRPLSELDREAYKRGNSVYLPNLVIPMLPEVLSNDLCSLRPKVNRPCLACRIEIDREGNLRTYEFRRAVMKSAARLTYREVQEAIDGKLNPLTADLFKTVLQPLYEAYFALNKARKRRGALELSPIEIKVKVDKNGNIQSIAPAEHYTAHEIIEEFMIAANVAAAKTLQKSKLPVMYRIHEKPQEEKLKDLTPLLNILHLKLPDYPALQPGHLNHIIEECSKRSLGNGISDMVLRLQCQAKYSPENIGHFGLGLHDYVHFTSPIRRYADLLIHRALIKALEMPEEGKLEDDATIELFKETGEHLCVTERRAVSAERDTVSRFLSAYLEPSIGSDFEVKITGLTTAGIFVCIENLGAEGLIPMRSLPDDNYELTESGSEMCGRLSKRSFTFGEQIKARLMEASPITGGLIFNFVDENEGLDYYKKGRGGTAVALQARKPKKSSAPRKERKAKIKKTNRRKKKTEKEKTS